MRDEEPKLPIWMRPEPTRRRPRFSRERIASAALKIADTEGFEAVTMRRVARELRAGTMTLYHYIDGRDDLLALMDDAIMSEVLVPDGEMPSEWREALTLIAHRSREAFARHPWALEGLRGTPFGPNGIRHFDQSLQAVASLDLELAEQIKLIAIVDDFVFGYVMRQREAPERAPNREDEVLAEATINYLKAELATGDYPEVARLFAARSRNDIWATLSIAWTQDRFEYGLERLLDGIALELEREPPSMIE